jgi:glutamyl-Q tRNA(Asp) synthetase
VQAGATDSIISTLAAFGFEWDGEIMLQSQRHQAYVEAFTRLQNQHLIYPCTCTRKEIADSSSYMGIEVIVYPRTCLNHAIKANTPAAWRIKTQDQSIHFIDAIQGEIVQNLQSDIGDFVLKRADGIFTYQLAVVVDDAQQGITHVVRGSDLLNSTTRQIFLQQLLGFITPQYLHIPVVKNQQGEKLSKQTLASALSLIDRQQQLYDAFCFLGLAPPLAIKNATPKEMWRWAIAEWKVSELIND